MTEDDFRRLLLALLLKNRGPMTLTQRDVMDAIDAEYAGVEVVVETFDHDRSVRLRLTAAQTTIPGEVTQ